MGILKYIGKNPNNENQLSHLETLLLKCHKYLGQVSYVTCQTEKFKISHKMDEMRKEICKIIKEL